MALDYGINISPVDQIQQNNNISTNPFISKHYIDYEQSYKYKRVLVAYLYKTSKIEEFFFNKEMTTDELNKMKKVIYLTNSNLNLLKNRVHCNAAVIMDKETLKQFKHFGVVLEDEEIVIPIFNIKYTDLILYLQQYENSCTVYNLYNILIMNEYFNVTHFKQSTTIDKYIKECKDAMYWNISNNCKLNMTSVFNMRDFDFTSHHRFSDSIQTVVKKFSTLTIQDIQNDNYLGLLYNHSKYDTAFNNIAKKGYKLYKITNTDETLKNAHFNDLIEKFDDKQTFNFVNSMLVSKKYCHNILNNKHMLTKIKPLFDKYKDLYRYILMYSFLTMYTEESITKTNIKQTNRFVFDIRTACNLPSFPFCYKNPTLNPYMPVLIDESILDVDNNVGGVQYYKNTSHLYGINTLEMFKENANIFITGKNNNILDLIDWTDIVMTGSIITACCPKYNPLMDLFKTSQDVTDQKCRYYNEYYGSSDVDILCSLTDSFKFIDRVKQFESNLKSNLLFQYDEDNVILTLNKKGVIIVDEKFIKQYIVTSILTYKYICSNINSDEIKQLFYKFYLVAKKYNCSLQDKDEEKYIDYYSTVPIEDINILFSSNAEYFKNTTDDVNTLPQKYKFNVENEITIEEGKTDYVFKYYENLKYSITSSNLLHKFEMFKGRTPEPFSIVSRFHLPCVRAYYNGVTVYMLPSCVSACMTLQNIDYKYFAGTNDPIEIINKYRMRGFGTYLNKKELYQYIKYSSTIEKWKNLLEIKNNSINHIRTKLGQLDVNNSLFKPNLVNFGKDMIDELYCKIKRCTLIDKIDLHNEVKNNKSETIDIVFSNKKITMNNINHNGYIIQYSHQFAKIFYTVLNM
jgi:hypothetical protein